MLIEQPFDPFSALGGQLPPETQQDGMLTIEDLKNKIDGMQKQFQEAAEKGIVQEADGRELFQELDRIKRRLSMLERFPENIEKYQVLFSAVSESLTAISNGLRSIQKAIQRGGKIETSGVSLWVKNECMRLKGLRTFISSARADSCVKFLAEGKAKEIYDPLRGASVYLVAHDASGVTSVFTLSLKEGELRQELKISEHLKSKLGAETAGEYLVLVEEVKDPAEMVEGRFTLKCEKADSDLEDFLADPKNTYDPFQLGEDGLSSVSLLHEADLTHGDLKPDNFLMFHGRVRMTDFGKTKHTSDGEDFIYSGNPRHEPPERRQSKPGDVYGMGIVLGQILERKYLSETKKMLVDVSESDRKSGAPDESRIGLERYLILCKESIQTESGGSLKSASLIGQRLGRMLCSPSDAMLADADRATGIYINQLVLELQSKYPDNTEAQKGIDELGELIKRMMSAHPAARPSAKEALAEYRAIRQKISPQKPLTPGPSE